MSWGGGGGGGERRGRSVATSYITVLGVVYISMLDNYCSRGGSVARGG